MATAMAPSMHGDVANAIGQQVEQMILQAKRDSESRVKHDLTATRAQLQQMQGCVAELKAKVDRYAAANGGRGTTNSAVVDRASLTQNIQKLEQKWGDEVKALKQDLHRTILAHNHNSDLMRTHRDYLDNARTKLDQLVQPKVSDVDAQIEKVDRMLRAGQMKSKAVEMLSQKLDTLEMTAAEIFPGPAIPGFPPMPADLMMGMNPMMSQPKTASKKKGAEPPSEEDVRARLLQAARMNAAAESSQFNAQAPVFIPGGASPSSTLVNLENAIVGEGADNGDESDADEEAVGDATDALAGDEAADTVAKES